MLTRSGVCGAIMDPNLPNVEQVPMKECLMVVGNISLVITYKLVKAAVAPNFPNR